MKIKKVDDKPMIIHTKEKACLLYTSMPDIEKFITENDIGEFTGFTQRSGFCEYPLYLFNVDKLRDCLLYTSRCV